MKTRLAACTVVLALAAFGAAARQRVEQEFERSKMVGRQVEDYLELANRFNGRTSC